MNAQRIKEALLVVACIAVDCVLLSYDPKGWAPGPLYAFGVIAVLGQVLAVALIASMRRGTLWPVVAMLISSVAGGGLVHQFSAGPPGWSMLTALLLIASAAIYVAARAISVKYPNRLPRAGKPTPGSRQFSIARIMIWTAVVAVVLAMLRRVRFNQYDLIFICCFVGVSLVGVVAGGIAIFDKGLPLGIRAAIFGAMILVGFVFVTVVPESEIVYGAIVVAWVLMLTYRILIGTIEPAEPNESEPPA